MSNLYQCNGTASFEHSRKLTAASQNHKLSFNDEYVTSLIFHYQVIKFVPRGIGKISPNLESLFMDTQLEEITREDFSHLTKLKQLDFIYSKIKSLDSNVFDDLPNIEYFSMYSSKLLRHVAVGVFDNWKNIKVLLFGATWCVDGKVNDRNIEEIKKQIALKCPPNDE
jgi:Leucine-rich repeat (LRR) protein